MLEILVRYGHFLGVFILFSTLVVEHLLLKRELAPAELRRLSIIDAIYGATAGVVLAAGLLLWFFGDKPASFYSANPVFFAKIGLFVVAALLSIYPTVFFVKNRKAAAPVAVPRSVVMTVRLELLLLAVIPLLAVLMAQGYGK